jgi:nucleoid-associated protein Lsr2
MAQRVQVILVCDLHDDDTPGTETVPFAMDGTSYEIDLCDRHAAEMRDSLARYVGAARRGSGRSGGGGRRRRGRGGSGEAAKIREWARSQGLPVPERGRIPADLADKYAAAH